MKTLALKLLRKAANYTGSATTGLAVAAIAGGATAPLAVGLLGIVGLCLLIESGAEACEPDERLSRIETWLEELVRRHGQLDAAIDAIAEGREADDLVSCDRADTLRRILVTSDEELDHLLEEDGSANAMLAAMSQHLERQDQHVLTALEKQADQLGRIETSVEGSAESLAGLHQKMDRVLASRDRVPSEEELEAKAIDEQDNCRLRTDALLALLDDMEHMKARSFADRCQSWLERSRNGLSSSPSLHARLLKQLLDEAIIRSRMASEDTQLQASDRMRQLVRWAQDLLPNLEEPDQLQLSSQAAYVESLLGAPTTALAQLDGRSDPYAIRRRIAILSDLDRHVDATDLIRGASPATEWVEKGIIAATKSGAWAEADRLLTWALGATPPRVQRACRLLFVENVVISCVGDDGPVPTADITDTDRQRITRARELLQPLIGEVLSVPEPRHELDYCVVRLGIDLATQIEDAGELRRLVPVLARRRPFDLALGVLAVRGRVEAGRDWVHRLRVEGTSSFDRQLIAAALEARQPHSQRAAFRAAVGLAEQAATDDDRKRLHGLLQELVQQLDESALKQFDGIAPSLVSPDDRQAQLWEIARALRAGRHDAVADQLAQLRDPSDSLWLQLHGQFLLQKGKSAEGIADLVKAARLLDQPGVLQRVAGLALAHQQWEHASVLLERFLVFRPGDVEARAGLAMALHQQQQYEPAAKLLTQLAEERLEEPSHAINSAACLVQLGRPEDAVEALAKVCHRPDPPLQAVIGLAQLLVERDRPKEAFVLANQHRQRFWNQYEFVGSYWSIAFAAQDESAGHEAFVQMRLLQAQGAAPADILVEKTLDDLIDLVKGYGEQERQSATAILQGRVPWLMVAELHHEPAYRAWAQRTGGRPWLFEHPVNMSGSAVYGTNAFTAVQIDGLRQLTRIEASDPGQPVVVDLSALITMQKLGVLHTVAGYCGRLHVPEAYLFKMFLDNDRLRPHQPSRQTVMTALRQALSDGRVQVDNDDHSEFRVLDEHYPNDEKPDGLYHLSDLLFALRTSGVAADEQLARLATVAHRPVTVSNDHEPIQVGDHLRITISTLSTLNFCGLLDTVISQFRVFLSAEDSRAVQGESLWFEAQERLRADHRELWEFLRDSPRVLRHARVPLDNDESDEDADNGIPSGIPFDSLALADRLGLPLLADDRCLQAVLLNQRPESASSSFGTVQLLASMARSGHISREEYAGGTRTLMDYRYRFLAPDPDLLLYWARSALSAPPGPDLQAVAAYLHACLRDPGLFGGPERTDPPSTIALKFYQAVEAAVGEFVAGLWADRSIPEDRARSFTAWGLHYLLPSPPTAMEPRIRMIGDFKHSLFFVAFFQKLVFAEDIDRARRGVAVVGETLGMDTQDIVRKAVEIIDAI